MTAFEVDLRTFLWPWLCAMKYLAFQTNRFDPRGIFLGGISWPNPKLKAQNGGLDFLRYQVVLHLS